MNKVFSYGIAILLIFMYFVQLENQTKEIFWLQKSNINPTSFFVT